MAHKSIFILFCAFQLYQIQNVSSSKKSPFKIDDFINQLMTSKKFSELTDIIAEKAAEKIRSVQQDKRQDRSSDKEFRKTEKKQTELPAPETVKKNENEKSKTGKSSTKFGKINTDAFLKQDLRSGEILLNYKHMTDELKRSDHKAKTQKNGAIFSDHNSKMNQDINSEKPKYQSRESKIHPRKQLKTNKFYEEIQRNFNKMNKSMDEDSSSGEVKDNYVNNTANDEAFEEHKAFIKTDEDVTPQVNVKRGRNSNENLYNHANSDKVDIKSVIKYSNSNIEKKTKQLNTIEISNKELGEHDKPIHNPERSSENVKKYQGSNNMQENRARETESSEKLIEDYSKHGRLTEETPENFNKNFKKYSKSNKYQENTNDILEISAKPVEVLIEMQKPKPQKIILKNFGNSQNKNRPKLRKETPNFRGQTSKATPKPDQTTERVEDYSDVLNFEGAKETLLKEPILKVPYPIISRENGKMYTHNYSEPDYKEYQDKYVSKRNLITLD